MSEQQRAASPKVCAATYNVPLKRLRAAIADGTCSPPRSLGRRSILTFSAVERWLESLPPVKPTTGDSNVEAQ